jgi:deoxyribodipyrimidine photo-lyase
VPFLAPDRESPLVVEKLGRGRKASSRAHPLRQARRFDPNGTFVRRDVPESALIEGGAVHESWQLRENATGYPTPIVDRT